MTHRSIFTVMAETKEPKTSYYKEDLKALTANCLRVMCESILGVTEKQIGGIGYSVKSDKKMDPLVINHHNY